MSPSIFDDGPPPPPPSPGSWNAQQLAQALAQARHDIEREFLLDERPPADCMACSLPVKGSMQGQRALHARCAA